MGWGNPPVGWERYQIRSGETDILQTEEPVTVYALSMEEANVLAVAAAPALPVPEGCTVLKSATVFEDWGNEIVDEKL
jgi:hypothetical protein